MKSQGQNTWKVGCISESGGANTIIIGSSLRGSTKRHWWEWTPCFVFWPHSMLASYWYLIGSFSWYKALTFSQLLWGGNVVSMSVDLHYGSPKLALFDSRLCAFLTFEVIQKLRTRSSKISSLHNLHSNTLLLLFAISTSSTQLLPHVDHL